MAIMGALWVVESGKHDWFWTVLLGMLAGTIGGGCIGYVFGILAGLVVAVESCQYFRPPFDIKKYRRVITIQSVAVATTFAMAATHRALFDAPNANSLTICVLFYACTCLSALWGSRKLADWYRDFSEQQLADVPAGVLAASGTRVSGSMDAATRIHESDPQ
jgi:hypothetical protein